MAHSIISDEINAGMPACVQPVYTKRFIVGIIKCHSIYSRSCIEEHVIRCKYLICHFKSGIPQPVFPEIMSGIVR